MTRTRFFEPCSFSGVATLSNGLRNRESNGVCRKNEKGIKGSKSNIKESIREDEEISK